MRARAWITIALILVFIGALFYIGSRSVQNEKAIDQAAGALFAASFALSMGLAARSSFGRGAWLIGSGLTIVAILLGCLALSWTEGAAEMFGAGRAASKVTLTFLFSLFTWLAACGSRGAFHRRWWWLGIPLVVLAVFLTFCAAYAVFEFVKALG